MTDIVNVLIGGNLTPYVYEDLVSTYGEKEAKNMSLEGLKYTSMHAVNVQHAKFLRDLTGGATVEERDTWQAKELAARAFVDDVAEPAEIDMLETEASYLGVQAADVAATIIGKADLFKKLMGLAAGVRGKARAAIKAATTPEQLQSAVDTAKTDVQDALAVFTGG